MDLVESFRMPLFLSFYDQQFGSLDFPRPNIEKGPLCTGPARSAPITAPARRGLTRAALGREQNLSPFCFSSITPKPLQISTQNLLHLIPHQSDIECSNFVEIDRKIVEEFTFLWGHFTPILTQIGSVLRNSSTIGL